MTGEVLEGQKLEAHTAICPGRGKGGGSLHGVLVVIVFRSCNEEKACLAPSLRRISGDETTQ